MRSADKINNIKKNVIKTMDTQSTKPMIVSLPHAVRDTKNMLNVTGHNKGLPGKRIHT